MTYSLEQLALVGIDVEKPKDFKQLSAQQEAFCQAYVFGGLTKTAAYRAAYNVGEDAQAGTVNGMAWRVSQLPHVRNRIAALFASRSQQTSLDTVRIRDSVINQLMETLEHSDNEKLRVQAAVSLGKMPAVGLYEKSTGDDDDKTDGTVIELKAIVTKIKERLDQNDAKEPPAKPRK